ncbi:hypothetical protein GWI33_015066 [Rhynchophorus ferrugineus]|uniref:Uncharacterized protein n=1 Tax=Rhynchophorus ferrugineus TaxID=354439 RepID=A0A834I3Z6_RHYFE|nr:hypothetical protein GWI33_015066 [Rhynchophorus ferrugineus]
MRSCTVLCSLAVILLVLAAFFGLLGHCNNDNKTIIACGLFLLGGLSLGCGLVSFVAALTQTLSEIYEYHSDGPSGPDYDYRYGWCFFVASIALVLSYCSSALSFIGYLHRYTSIDEMLLGNVKNGRQDKAIFLRAPPASNARTTPPSSALSGFRPLAGGRIAIPRRIYVPDD